MTNREKFLEIFGLDIMRFAEDYIHIIHPAKGKIVYYDNKTYDAWFGITDAFDGNKWLNEEYQKPESDNK